MKNQSPLKFAYKHLEDKTSLALAVFWSIIFVLVPMQLPVLTGALIDGIDGREVKIYGFIELSRSPEQVLTFVASSLIIVAAVYGISGYFRKTGMAKVSRRLVSRLRKALTEKLEVMSLDVHGKYGSGELLSRVVIDTQAMRRFTESVFVKTATNVVRVAYPMLMLLIIDPFLALIASSVLPVQWAITNRLQKKLHKASKQARTSKSRLITVVKENLDGIETIQTSNAETVSIARISDQSEKLESNELKTNKYSAIIAGSVWALTGIGLALTWWQGGLRVLSGDMTIGTLVVFTGFVTFIYSPFRRFTDVVNVYQKGIVAVERIQEILDADSSVKESPSAKPLNMQGGSIEFQNVYFSYAGQGVLKEINLSIPPNSFTGIIGESGSGKSSLLKLIARLYDPIEGRILIDGQDIREVTLNSLRSQIAVVPQSPVIFSGTAAENIRLSKPDATDGELEEACQAADALRFIRKLEKGFDTRLGQGGVNLSGGEAQRISIARAVLRKPQILLLDEPTSALDPETESAIMRTLSRLKNDMTVIMVGHNSGIIGSADRLIVMSNGRVMEDGTREELISSPGFYRNLYMEGGAA